MNKLRFQLYGSKASTKLCFAKKLIFQLYVLKQDIDIKKAYLFPIVWQVVGSIKLWLRKFTIVGWKIIDLVM